MKIRLILLLVVGLVACSEAAPPADGCTVEPEIFCGPFEEMAAEMPQAAKDELLALPKDEYWKLHRGLGLAVRNRFGLWQDTDLSRFFRANGIDHPESMSEPFIAGYVAYLQGRSVDMAAIVKEFPPPQPPPPPPSAPDGAEA